MDESSKSILDEVAEYIGMTDEDAQLLRAAHPLLEPHFERIVEDFYAAVQRTPDATKVLESPAQIARLKKSLTDWLDGLFSGVYDDSYLQRRARIGRVHVRIGLEQRYMFAAMNLIRAGLEDATHRTMDDRARAMRTCTAIDRICDVELAIMLETYRDAYTSGLRSERRALTHDLHQIRSEKAELAHLAAHHEALATIGTLTAGLAHEVRNPLNAAKLQLELIGRAASKVESSETSARIRNRVGLVNDELSRLSEMLDDFLALARQRRLERETFALLPLVEEVVDLERPVADEEAVELVIGFCDDTTVDADRSKIKQVLVNLVSNSVESMHGTGGRVELGCSTSSDEVCIWVSDTGPGIAPEVVDTLFEPFVTTKEAGTGLGLSIVKRIVQSHGGQVSVETSYEGTTIRFTLPNQPQLATSRE
jgi:signal transduction histidine kinase